jgi:hypothetical protein
MEALRRYAGEYGVDEDEEEERTQHTTLRHTIVNGVPVSDGVQVNEADATVG